MALTLRQAQVTDLPSIYRGEQDYIRCWEPDHESAWRIQLERHLTRWVENFERFTIASMDEQFAGYALWTAEQDHAEICTLNVSPSHGRCGIGRALLEACTAAALREGFTLMKLSVKPENPARHLYERAGFVRSGIDTHGYLQYERRTDQVPRP
ncbi:GNAT family N-acetyltransferase [Pseudomonas sp. REP124]|uniref:GNAT family N-acetyltransferase n=1 Tax=Pseudomonas sp. REP124 TaxID=2875731 RepID=UPI001CCB1397|nr:GNAT family N-acetyltransferase [Pseudomonas sp. REP124]MBZ9779938.1 GNAT family N-acetyltransferase [Pseudomonas sp. REP124]